MACDKSQYENIDCSKYIVGDPDNGADIYNDKDCTLEDIVKCKIKDIYYQDDSLKCIQYINCCDIFNYYDKSNNYCVR